MVAVFWLVLQVLNLIVWAVLISVIFNLLIAFGVINGYQPLVRTVVQFLSALTEPLLAPIRRFLWRVLPSTGSVDLSPLVLILLLQALSIFIRTTLAPAFGVVI